MTTDPQIEQLLKKLIVPTQDLAQLGFACIGMLVWFFHSKREKSLWFIFLAAHIILMLVACFFNGSVDFGQIRRAFCQIGFCFLCAEMILSSQKTFLRAGLAVFTVDALWGLLTVYIFPRGFTDAKTTYEAIYGLGAKNNSFPWFFTFFFFVYTSLMEENKKLTWLIPLFVVAAMIAGLICESVNTVVCLLLVLVLYFLARFFKPFFAKINPLLCLIAFVAVIVLVYAGTESELLGNILAKFGRSATFSGRDVLWNQALTHFSEHPLFGAGWDITFTLRGGEISSHAHSQWLDKLAKFGLVQAVFLAGIVYLTINNARKCKVKWKGNVLAFLLLIYMLHMSFDTYNYNFFTMFLIVINNVLLPEHTTQNLE